MNKQDRPIDMTREQLCKYPFEIESTTDRGDGKPGLLKIYNTPYGGYWAPYEESPMWQDKDGYIHAVPTKYYKVTLIGGEVKEIKEFD